MGLRDPIEKKIRFKSNDKRTMMMMVMIINGDNTAFSIGEWDGKERKDDDDENDEMSICYMLYTCHGRGKSHWICT